MAVALLAGSGCDLTQPNRATDDVQQQYALWLEARPTGYEFVLSQGCTCPVDQERPTRIRVQGVAPTTAHDVQTGEPLSLADPRVLSIDEIFDVLVAHMERPLASATMAFDANFHYPTSFHGWLPGLGESEFRFVLEDFVPGI